MFSILMSVSLKEWVLLNKNLIIYLLFNKDPPQNGLDDLSLHIPTTHGNSPFVADIPRTILSLIFLLYGLEWCISEMGWNWLNTLSSLLVILEALVPSLFFTSLQLVFQTLQMIKSMQHCKIFMISKCKAEPNIKVYL